MVLDVEHIDSVALLHKVGGYGGSGSNKVGS